MERIRARGTAPEIRWRNRADIFMLLSSSRSLPQERTSAVRFARFPHGRTYAFADAERSAFFSATTDWAASMSFWRYRRRLDRRAFAGECDQRLPRA